MGPTLAHGRNIVNVILVDFRAMDTLGEITVLTTAAIGVRALVGLGAFDNDGDGSGARDLKTSVILRTGTRLMMPLLLLFAMFLLARGHNQPGGGFVAALVVSAAFAIYSMAYGVEAARRALLVHPERLLGVGLLVALVAGLAGVASGHAFLTARWTYFGTALGTPLLFDIGVFLVVVGVVLTMVFTLAEE
jgi:multicomponent Na+:H+ antiporter subunit A